MESLFGGVLHQRVNYALEDGLKGETSTEQKFSQIILDVSNSLHASLGNYVGKSEIENFKTDAGFTV